MQKVTRIPEVQMLRIHNMDTQMFVNKSKISALRKDPRPYSRCLHGVFVMNFGFTLTPTITLTIAPKEADTSPPPEQTNKQV